MEEESYTFTTINEAYLQLNKYNKENHITFGYTQNSASNKEDSVPVMYVAFGPAWEEDRKLVNLTEEQFSKLREFINYVYETKFLPIPRKSGTLTL